MKIPGNFVTYSLLILVLSLNACGGLTQSNKPAMKTWWLEPYTDITPVGSAVPDLFLSVSVTVVPGLDTDRILTLSDNAELNQYSAARWAENLPELLASLTSRTLESSGRFQVVSARAANREQSCNLHLDLHEFFADLNPSGQTTGVRLAVNGRYQCGSAEAVSLRVSASIPVQSNRMDVIVAAFQRAMDTVMQEILLEIPAGQQYQDLSDR